MEMKPILEVTNISKRYTITHLPGGYLSFREQIQNMFKFRKKNREEFWALREVTFDVQRSDSIGIIGRNGAGKSTLLKVLSRITKANGGRIVCRGRIASLLEVGTGFHPELTGRENIFLNGSLLGMKRQEILLKFDEIVDFSGTEQFLDTPLKHYSSGMQLRLAFSVAAFLEPEILIVDEVLAVGDAEFQKKCIGKMEQVTKSGRTILFVSHNLAAVEALCNRGILLDKGRVVESGALAPVLRKYQESYQLGNATSWEKSIDENEPVYFSRIALELMGAQPVHKLRLTCVLVSRTRHRDALLAFDISNSMGITVFQTMPGQEPYVQYSEAPREIEIEIELPPLIPDQYWVSAWIGPHNNDSYCWEQEVIAFEINSGPTPGRSFPYSHQHGFLVTNSRILT